MRIKNKLLAFWLLCKRLLKKKSFVLGLMLIPIVTLVFSAFADADGDTGLLHIALASRDGDEYAEKVMESLANSEGLVVFELLSSFDEAEKSVSEGKNDAAWIFEEGFYEKLCRVAKGERLTLITARLSEDSVVQRMAREKVYALLYPEISRLMYVEFSSDGLFVEGATEEEINASYDDERLSDDLVTFNFQSSSARIEEVNYLTAPLRGMLCILVMICGFCSSLYFLADERLGVYGLVSFRARYLILLLSNMAALTMAGGVMITSLFLCGEAEITAAEITVMALFVIASAGFSTFFAALVRDVGAFCVLTVGVFLSGIVLSPVFLDISSLRVLQVAYPSYHYLYAANGEGVFELILYAAASVMISCAGNFLVSKVRKY